MLCVVCGGSVHRVSVPAPSQPSLLHVALLLGDHSLAFVQPLLVLPQPAASEFGSLLSSAMLHAACAVASAASGDQQQDGHLEQQQHEERGCSQQEQQQHVLEEQSVDQQQQQQQQQQEQQDGQQEQQQQQQQQQQQRAMLARSLSGAWHAIVSPLVADIAYVMGCTAPAAPAAGAPATAAGPAAHAVPPAAGLATTSHPRHEASVLAAVSATAMASLASHHGCKPWTGGAAAGAYQALMVDLLSYLYSESMWATAIFVCSVAGGSGRAVGALSACELEQQFQQADGATSAKQQQQLQQQQQQQQQQGQQEAEAEDEGSDTDSDDQLAGVAVKAAAAAAAHAKQQQRQPAPCIDFTADSRQQKLQPAQPAQQAASMAPRTVGLAGVHALITCYLLLLQRLVHWLTITLARPEQLLWQFLGVPSDSGCATVSSATPTGHAVRQARPAAKGTALCSAMPNRVGAAAAAPPPAAAASDDKLPADEAVARVCDASSSISTSSCGAASTNSDATTPAACAAAPAKGHTAAAVVAMARAQQTGCFHSLGTLLYGFQPALEQHFLAYMYQQTGRFSSHRMPIKQAAMLSTVLALLAVPRLSCVTRSQCPSCSESPLPI